MEDNQKKIEEINKKNRIFFAKAGTIFLSVIIGILWLINFFQFSIKSLNNSNIAGEDLSKEKINFSQARKELSKILNNVGEQFEEIKDKKQQTDDAEMLLEKIKLNASSSLDVSGIEASTESISILSLMSSTTASTTASTTKAVNDDENILKK